MKRLDVIVQYGNVGDAYTLAVDDEDGDFVWWDEAANRIEELERQVRISRDVIESHVGRDIRHDVLAEVDRRIADPKEYL